MAVHFEDDRVRIHKIVASPYDNNAYIVVCKATGKSLIIDTPRDADLVLAEAAGTDVTAVAITHGHRDHIEGYDAFRAGLTAPIGLHREDTPRLAPNAPDFHLRGRRDPAGRRAVARSAAHAGPHGGRRLPASRQAPLLGRHPLSRRPRQDPDPRGPRPGHREHHRQAARPAGRHRRLPRPRRRHHHRRREGGVRRLRRPPPRPRPLRRRPLARSHVAFPIALSLSKGPAQAEPAPA